MNIVPGIPRASWIHHILLLRVTRLLPLVIIVVSHTLVSPHHRVHHRLLIASELWLRQFLLAERVLLLVHVLLPVSIGRCHLSVVPHGSWAGIRVAAVPSL